MKSKEVTFYCGYRWYKESVWRIEFIFAWLQKRISHFLRMELRKISGNKENDVSCNGNILKKTCPGDAKQEKTLAPQMQKAEEVLDKYGNTVLRMAYAYLHNLSDAEDILQDTLIRYMQSAPEFENEQHEKAWILTVGANLSKNKIQYNKLRTGDELDENLMAEEKTNLAFVWEAVRLLPVKYREVIHLYYEEGYRTKEISRILGRAESSIRSDLRRGREKLRTILKEAYDFE